MAVALIQSMIAIGYLICSGSMFHMFMLFLGWLFILLVSRCSFLYWLSPYFWWLLGCLVRDFYLPLYSVSTWSFMLSLSCCTDSMYLLSHGSSVILLMLNMGWFFIATASNAVAVMFSGARQFLSSCLYVQ